MELDQIKAIVELMKENDLSEFSMENDGLKIRIKRGPEGFQPAVTIAPVAPVAAATAPAAPVEAPAAPAAVPADIKYITSPMVGTFYRSPTPDSAPYAEPGKNIEGESVVCIIEAMKVMNEIKAECSGTLLAVVAEDGSPVQFGDVLFRVR